MSKVKFCMKCNKKLRGKGTLEKFGEHLLPVHGECSNPPSYESDESDESDYETNLHLVNLIEEDSE
jgi:hypothetical protein